jgi:hypothetical protein
MNHHFEYYFVQISIFFELIGLDIGSQLIKSCKIFQVLKDHIFLLATLKKESGLQ